MKSIEKKATPKAKTTMNARGATMPLPAGKPATKKPPAKKASAASSAHAMPSGSRGSPSRTLSQVTNDLIGAANQTVKAVVKAIVPPKRAKPVDATVRLPKQLTPFAGWPTDPTDKDIQDVVTARKMFSTDLG